MRRPSSSLWLIRPLLPLAPAQVQDTLRADVEGLKLGGALPQNGARKEPRAKAGRQLRPAGLQEAVELPGRPLLGLVHMVVVVVLLGRLGSPERPGVVAAPASVLVNAAAEAAAEAAAVEARHAHSLPLMLGHELLSSGEDDQAPPAPPRSPLATPRNSKLAPPKSELAPPGGARASYAAAGATVVAAAVAVSTAWW